MRIETEVALGQLARLKSAFDRLPTKLQRLIIREETREAAKKILLPKLKIYTPSKTGRLRKALAVRAIKKARNKVGVRMALTASKFKQGGKAGTAWKGVIPFYAGFLEWGWRVGKRSKDVQRKQKALSRLKSKGYDVSDGQDIEGDTRKKVKGREFMTDVAKRYGDIATETAAKEMARRIGEEFRKL